MKKAQILARIDSIYKKRLVTELVETIDNVKRYRINVLEMGKDEDGVSISYKRNLYMNVYDEGGAGEVAGIEKVSPINEMDKSRIAANPSAPTALEIYNLYKSDLYRKRVTGLMVRAANDIYNEDPATANHAQRMKWATAIMKDASENLNTMMVFVSMNSTVLSGTATDEDIRFIVNSNIDKWALTVYGA